LLLRRGCASRNGGRFGSGALLCAVRGGALFGARRVSLFKTAGGGTLMEKSENIIGVL